MDPEISRALGKSRIVLASKSPRRKEILEKEIGFKNISIFPSGFEENLDKDVLAPFEYVLETAQQKAIDVYRAEVDADIPPGLVVGADTIIVNNGQILEKPRGIDHHVHMLKTLRDSSRNGPHKVFTAVACIVPLEVPIQPGYALETHLEETSVYFKTDVSDEEIVKYVSSGEGTDAAGGYKIQETGGKILVDRIEGDYFNVVGLPVNSTISLIKKALKSAKDIDSEDDEDDDY